MLLDTNIVSAVRRPRNNLDLIAWLERQPALELRLPGPVLAELVYGVQRVREPAARAMYDAWLQAIRDTHQLVAMTADAFALYGEMLARPSLASFRITPPGSRRPHLAADLQIAAIAITEAEPLATLNFADFARIAGEFPALQLLNPRTGETRP